MTPFTRIRSAAGKIYGIACFFLVALLFCAVSCTNLEGTLRDSAKEETMFQSATLQSLMTGNYDGYISVAELRSYGNIGLGTFERVDGEMIVLDGTVFQAKADGSVAVADDGVMVPFAVATHFDDDIRFSVENVCCLDSLMNRMSDMVDANGRNFIYAVRIDVNSCDYVKVRSVCPQQKPYKPLAEALKTDQREHILRNVGGTIVGVYFPAYMGQLNAAGWHCHFITADRSRGGHLLDIAFASKTDVRLDLTPAFNLYMPEEKSFANADLARDLTSEIESVEK